MKLILVVSLTAFILVLFIGCSEGTSSEPSAVDAQSSLSGSMAKGVSPTPISLVTPEMVEGLLYMREEEKVARDVYTVLGKKWNVKVFSTIIKSEQQHMDALAQLIKRYGLVDPVTDNTVGVFTNLALQDLYLALVAQGSTSVKDAYTVGITTEQVDISDLVAQLNIVPAGSDLAKAYTNLKAGSENHLAAFRQALQRLP